MKLNVIGDPKAAKDARVKAEQNEVDQNAMGGTEIMKHALFDKLENNILTTAGVFGLSNCLRVGLFL